MYNLYGYVYMSVFHATGPSEIGAKRAATQARCELVGYQSYINNMFISTARKCDGVWLDVKSPEYDKWKKIT